MTIAIPVLHRLPTQKEKRMTMATPPFLGRSGQTHLHHTEGTEWKWVMASPPAW